MAQHAANGLLSIDTLVEPPPLFFNIPEWMEVLVVAQTLQAVPSRVLRIPLYRCCVPLKERTKRMCLLYLKVLECSRQLSYRDSGRSAIGNHTPQNLVSMVEDKCSQRVSLI